MQTLGAATVLGSALLCGGAAAMLHGARVARFERDWIEEATRRQEQGLDPLGAGTFVPAGPPDRAETWGYVEQVG